MKHIKAYEDISKTPKFEIGGSKIKINNRTEYEYDTGLYDNIGNRIYIFSVEK
jgi:hypothetical protein